MTCCPQYIRFSPTIGSPQYIPRCCPQHIRSVTHNIYRCTHNIFRPRSTTYSYILWVNLYISYECPFCVCIVDNTFSIVGVCCGCMSCGCVYIVEYRYILWVCVVGASSQCVNRVYIVGAYVLWVTVTHNTYVCTHNTYTCTYVLWVYIVGDFSFTDVTAVSHISHPK